MALYSEHLDDVIYKSSFKIDIADAFISPSGDIIMAVAFCHCKLACDIIRKITDEHYLKKEKIQKEIDKLKKYLKSVENENLKYQLNKLAEQLSDMEQYGTCKDVFNAVHLNKGYDEAEFLVSHLGYIGIEGHYLLYNRKMVNSIQLSKLGLSYHYENDGKIITNE